MLNHLDRMNKMQNSIHDALSLLTEFDSNLIGIVATSLQVSLSALFLGSMLGLPIGAFLATEEFTGKRAIIVILNTLMGVPTVIVGVLVYLLLSHNGPLGTYGCLR